MPARFWCKVPGHLGEAGAMADFLVADLNSKGELQLREPYSYEALERIPGAGDLIARCSGALWRTPEHFEIPLNPGAARLTLRWSASAPTAGMATIRFEESLMSLSLLATGIDA